MKQGIQSWCSATIEGWDGEGDGSEVQDGGTHVHPWLIHVEYGKNRHDVSSNYPPIKISKLI